MRTCPASWYNHTKQKRIGGLRREANTIMNASFFLLCAAAASMLNGFAVLGGMDFSFLEMVAFCITGITLLFLAAGIGFVLVRNHIVKLKKVPL